MKAGELEQVANDSVTVVVNSKAKMIKLFSNTNTLSKSMERIIPGVVPDASLQQLSRKYAITTEDNGKDRTMTVQSRDKIPGTDLAREMIAVTYQPGTCQPFNYTQVKRSLLPVDSAAYAQMETDPAYAGRIIKTGTIKGELFFVMKERTTGCRFVEISHSSQAPPVLQQQRVVKTGTGEYIPAKGFEEYLVSKEF